MNSSSRSACINAIFGVEFSKKVKETRILVVGSGGIGCELLKDIVLAGFGDITLLDLDTIDLSNLNRQFLFRKKDVKQPKALVAARTAATFNPSVKIDPICANIKDAQYDAQWFAGFHIVLSALDNLDARKHINRMCLAAGVPLVESGTEGYFGQVQPILQGRTECYECSPKPIQQKTYPVCTIRSTPSQPIHTIVWAKSYLLPQLFGEEENEAELDKAEQDGENPTEIATLRKEAQEWKRMREALRSPDGNTIAGRTVFEKAFTNDTMKLLAMEDMWQNRERPVPLDFDSISAGEFVLRGEKQSRYKHVVNGTSNGHGHSSGLRDQRSLTLPESLDLFISSVDRLSHRLKNGEDIISFDKDDDDTLDFVTAASNLRSSVYNIPQKNRWDVKEMAGNIIPAIATTNAIIAGLIVLQALHILRGTYDQLVWPYLTAKQNKPITGSQLPPPNPDCAACRDTYTLVQCDPSQVTLGQLVEGVLGIVDLEGEEEDSDSLDATEVSVFEAGRLLADPDFESNMEKTLADLGCGRGKFVSIVDEDGRWETLTVSICLLPDSHPTSAPPLLLATSRPLLKRKPKTEPQPASEETMEERPLLKRKYSPDANTTGDGEVDGPARKKLRANDNTPFSSPTKAQKLEEDGFVILDEDVIVLD